MKLRNNSRFDFLNKTCIGLPTFLFDLLVFIFIYFFDSYLAFLFFVFQNSYTPNFSTPARVIFLRILAFLSCVFLVVLAVYGSEDPFTPASSLHSPPAQPMLNHSNVSGSSDGNAAGGQGAPVWQELFSLVPQEAVENLKVAWDYGKSHQMAVVSLGLFTCLMAVFLAGRIR